MTNSHPSKEAILHMEPGWYKTPLGVFVRTDHTPDGLAYLVTIFTSNALPTPRIEEWKEQKNQFIEESARAGQKGAHGKLAQLGTSLHELFMEYIEIPLRAGGGTRMTAEQINLLATGIHSDEHCTIYALNITGNHLHVLLTPNGETAFDSLIRSWQNLCPEITWTNDTVVEAISPRQKVCIPTWFAEDLPADALEPVPTVSAAEACIVPSFHHVTVLLEETVDLLAPAEGKLIIDATLGGGGHSELLLEHGATVWGIDQDPEARHAATQRLARFGDRFRALCGNFRNVEAILAAQGISQVDGMLADIGISSHQVDTPERGFSFRENGPLDMRMNPLSPISAKDIVNKYDESQIRQIIWEFGEERASRSITRAIIHAREQGSIDTTAQLADIVASVMPRKGKQHPATRTFQALRIAVNDELGALDDFLSASVRLLKQNGRIAVISFHSLEDRRVKHFFDYHSKPEIDRKEWPAPRPNPDYIFNLLTKRPISPGEEEIQNNPRSRSAKLRGAKKIY